jgi:predicted RecA/RadA family phage recombinase
LQVKNFIQPGGTITVIAPSNVTSGVVVIVGSIVGIAAFDAPTGQPVEVSTEGVFTLPKVLGDALAQGATAKVSAGIVGSAGSIAIGWVVAAAASGSTTVSVRLCPGISPTATTLAADSAGAPKTHQPGHEHIHAR